MSEFLTEGDMTDSKQWAYEAWLSSPKCAIVILNTPLNSAQTSIISRLWSSACLKTAVDGGANHLFQQLPLLTPDLITGDFDSISPVVLAKYRERKVDIVKTPDQNSTDFTKCLQVVLAHVPDPGLEVILVFCTPTGRLDQIMGNVQTLYESGSMTRADVVLHAGDELTWVLRKGRHRIWTPKALCGRFCGLIPVGSPAIVTTEGLKWNLKSRQLAFKHLVSTSNAIVADEVTVETSEDILWTMTLDR